MSPLTHTQARALQWLHIVGKATPKTIRKHGYSERTFQALVKQGRVDVEHVPTHSPPFTNVPVYRIAKQ